MAVTLLSKQVHVEFSPAFGLKDKQYRRQDPSNILKIGEKYHVWYARHPASMQWNQTRSLSNVMEIWMAISSDGRYWQEHGRVLPPSKPGAWHERATHAPHIVPWQGRYYLFFSAFHGHYSSEKRTGEKHIGLAVADCPQGPYKHWADVPMLSPSKDPKAFDHYLIDDPCVIRREGKFRLYYKGRNSNKSQCRLGVVVADKITGPYERVQSEPVCDADWHTGCVWPYRKGVAGIIDGQKGKNLAYSPDGLCFKLGGRIPEEILDPGVFCPDAFAETEYRHGITWGLAVGWQGAGIYISEPEQPEYIFRFDANLAVS